MSVFAALGAGLLLLVPGSARAGRADAGAAPSALSGTHAQSEVLLSARPLDNGAWAIEARVRDASVGPIGSQTVRFSATIEFLGVRRVDIGSARTDTSGTATLTYRPTWDGSHRIAARAPFDDGTIVSNEVVVEVTGAAPPLSTSGGRLATFGAWAGPAAALVVAAIWGLLALILVRVVVGISKAATVAAGPGGASSSRAVRSIQNPSGQPRD